MLLKDKKGLILGVANKHSIAWAIAQSAAREGAQIAFTYQPDEKGMLERRVRDLAAELPPENVGPIMGCDVGSDESIDALEHTLEDAWGKLDFLVHAVAFAPREELTGAYVNSTRAGYATAQTISVYSLPAVCRRVQPLFEKAGGGTVLTLTYLGSERVVPNYNTMGVAKAALEASVRYLAADLGPLNIRVNAISAGPIKTLSASGISDFTSILEHMRNRAPMRRNVEREEVGEAALFFLSNLSSAVTGDVLFVDCGYHIMGL
jgi:enoyl-[acyl-carrier protein] reductase I